MIASDTIADRLDDLTQLLRVRRMRVEAAQRALAVQTTAVERAETTLAEAREGVTRAEGELRAFRHRMASESAAALVTLGAMTGHFREHLERCIGQADAEVARAQDALVQAQRELDERRRVLRREQSRHDAIDEAAQRARIAVGRASQARDEEEAGDLRRPRSQEGLR